MCLLSFMTSACELGYYTHLAEGQFQMVSQRQPIKTLLADPATEPKLKQRLQLTQAALKFAEKNLHLDIDGQYSHYIALERPYALWSLSAAPSLSFSPHQWCYPIIGCANYRGYFNLERATAAEAALQKLGYETYIRGVSAYSTLGWFADPLLSSFARYSNEDFVTLIFHELAHSKMYIKNDTTFNESFATFVGQQGLKEFKEQGLLPKSEASKSSNKDFQAFKKLTLKYKEKLQEVYQSDVTDEEKLQQKSSIMTQLTQEYKNQKPHWDRPNAYDQWVENMNNATMLVFSDYESKVPFFKDLFITCNEDWACFYRESKSHSKVKAAE